jgi:hypothetical protein
MGGASWKIAAVGAALFGAAGLTWWLMARDGDESPRRGKMRRNDGDERSARRGLQQTARERDRAERQRRKDRLLALRGKVKTTRAKKTSAQLRAERVCKLAKARTQKIIADMRAREDKRIRDETKRLRSAQKEGCERRKKLAKAVGETALERARRERDEERTTQRAMRGAERKISSRAKGPKKSERRSESDDAVRAELPEELLPVWERVKRRITAKPGMSRAESFLHWAEEHSDEVAEMQALDAEDATERMIREVEERERQEHEAA